MSLNKLVVGSAQFGSDYGISNKVGVVSQKEIISILRECRKKDISYLDTASNYGIAERAIGNAIKSIANFNWNIITKINNSESNIFQQINKAKSKLKSPINTVLAHSSKLYMEKKIQNQLLESKLNGEIKNFGVSLYTKDEIIEVLGSEILPDIIQLPMNILDTRLYKNGFLKKINKKKIEVHARSVFLQGLFYLTEDLVQKKFPEVGSHLKKLNKIALKAGVSVAELSLLWVASIKEVKKVIIGVESSKQLRMHADSMKKKINEKYFENALKISFNNESILNPAKWN